MLLSKRLPVDYSKTKGAVLFDLSFKGLSAIAILVIGLASIRFQRNLANTQQQTRLQEQQEQKYLPLFRGISEVDLALAEISAELAMPSYTEEEAIRANRLGTRLAYLADSLYFPSDDFPQDGPDINVLNAFDNVSESQTPHPISLSATDSVRLLSELMRLEPWLQQMYRQDLVVRCESKSLVFYNPKGKFVDNLPLDARVVPAFKKWLPQQMRAYDLFHNVHVDTFADDISGQLTLKTKEKIGKYPELADKYVVIRNDVIRAREQLVPPK